MIPGDLPSGKWAAEHRAGTVSFTARKLGVLRVRGTMPITWLEVDVASGLPDRVDATVDAWAVDTGIERRDRTLRGRRFLATSTTPSIRFIAEVVRPLDDEWEVTGVVHVKGVQAPLSLRAAAKEIDTRGARVSAAARIDRRRIGLRRGPRWLIGRWVDISIEAEVFAVEEAGRRSPS